MDRLCITFLRKFSQLSTFDLEGLKIRLEGKQFTKEVHASVVYDLYTAISKMLSFKNIKT